MISKRSAIDSIVLLISSIVIVLFMNKLNLGLKTLFLVYFITTLLVFNIDFKQNITKLRRKLCVYTFYALLVIQINLVFSNDMSFEFKIFNFTCLFITLLFKYQFTLRQDKYLIKEKATKSDFLDREIDGMVESINRKIFILKGVISVLSLSEFFEMLSDLPRHSCVRYVSRNSLNEEFIENMKKTIDDENIYLILSDTGSLASNCLSFVTERKYNHISISFDCELKTMISYNGGEQILPPGLNIEKIEWFFKKEDASAQIYRLKISKNHKELLIDEVIRINQEGSSYNLWGIMSKNALKPNIMFCSQFVCSAFTKIGINYFDKAPLITKPTDFIELDKLNQLELLDTIYKDQLNKINNI